MFFFFQSSGAIEAFKEAARSEGFTYEQFAERVGVSRGTITKFIGGRPPSPSLLRAILKGLSLENGKKVLVGHLRDEIRRAGHDPERLVLLDQTPYTPLIARVAALLPSDPQRVVDLLALVASWEKAPAETDVKSQRPVPPRGQS